MSSINPELIYFNNGLRLIYQANFSVPVVTAQVWVNTGSADESPKQYGMAHVLEHMLFKGTKKYPGEKIASLIEANGGEINAFTSFDQTAFHLTIASRYLNLAIDTLADMVQQPLLHANSLDSEKEVIIEEIKRSMDTPGREISRLLFSTVFSGHPYGRPIIGTDSSVKSFTRKMVFQFFRKCYIPGNLIFIVIGNTDRDSVVKRLESAFHCRHLNSRNQKKTVRPRHHVRHKSKVPKRPRFAIKYKNINEAFVEFAFPVPDINHPDTAAIDLMCAIMCQGDTSFLYHDIKFTRQLVNDISAYSYTPRDSGIILISITLNPQKIRKSLPEIIKKLVEFKYRIPEWQELEKARVNILSDHIFQKETVDGQARKLGLYYSMSGNLGFEENYHRAVESTGPEQIAQLSLKYLQLNKLTAAFLLPGDFKEKINSKQLKKLVVSTFEEEEKKFKKTSSASFQVHSKTRNSLLMSNVTVHTINNGIKLILKRNPDIPIVAIRAALLGGVRFETETSNGSFALLARLFNMGTRTKSATDISNLIESRAASLAGYTGKNTFGLEGEFLSKYADDGFELFCDLLLNPSFPEREFENERKNMLEHIRVLEDNLVNYIFQIFSRKIFKTHPYRFHILGSVESVSSLKREKLVGYHRDLTHPDNLFISVVGNFDIDHVTGKLQDLLKPILQRPGVFPEVPREPQLTEPIIYHKEVDKEQTHILYGFRGTTISNRDRYVMDIIQSILSGQGGHLFTELRDKLALAYSVFAASMEGLDPGYFAIYVACSPSKTNTAIKHIKIELDRLKERRVNQRELMRAKKYLIGRQAIELQRNSAQAFSLVYDEIYAMGTGTTARYPEYITSITADDILDVANKYFDHNRSILTTVGQVSKYDSK